MVKPAREFVGTDRFTLLRRLGTGGMGVVYEAHDRKTDRIVALKTLTRAEAAHIYRFKREFRTLADVSHPNLVTLYELMSAGNDWFFTMELVHGVTFINYVRPDILSTQATDVDNTLPVRRGYGPKSADSEADTEIFDSSRISLDEDDDDFQEEESLAANVPLDEDRLRFALRQLAEGVNRLHELGKLHRDIKPSNVLVTEEGRVVILDFGLVEDINPELRETLLAGTPDYMSPEQGAQTAISKASDWYSVGVILYQALTSRLPFQGKFFEVMLRKQTRDPVQPREINPNLPRPERSVHEAFATRSGRATERPRDHADPRGPARARHAAVGERKFIPGPRKTDRRTTRRFSSDARRPDCHGLCPWQFRYGQIDPGSDFS